MTDSICVNDRVLVFGRLHATVRFIGPTAFADGVWYGLEFDDPRGQHDGTLYGVKYFTTPALCARFVRRKDIEACDAKVAAVCTIQCWMRKQLARKDFNREVTWDVLHALDVDNDHKLLIRRQKLLSSALGAYLKREGVTSRAIDELASEAEKTVLNSSSSVILSNDDETGLDTNYTGLHITFPLTSEQVCSMIAAFQRGETLHYKYVIQILAAYRRLATELPTLSVVSLPSDARITVCGDFHGQLQDLLSVFALNGLPSESNRYLMNGNFVDRGHFSCEIVLILMAFALVCPASCLLNRGNHEAYSQSITGGLLAEILRKYGSDLARGLRVYDLFQAAFQAMPLSYVLQNSEGRKVFVVHGGLMQRPGVSLAHIGVIKRKREIPYGHSAVTNFENQLFEGLMWSDPREVPGTIPSLRGAGVCFGPDVTHHFCENNDISLIVRSNECVPAGFQYMHDNMLLTVCSASNYSGRRANFASFVTFSHDLSHSITVFKAPSLTDIVVPSDAKTHINMDVYSAVKLEQFQPIPRALLAVDQTSLLDTVKHMIMERIVVHKLDLQVFWNRMDQPYSGFVSKHRWAEGMRVVLGLDLPWLTLAHTKFCRVDVNNDGNVHYMSFIERYTIALVDWDAKWMDVLLQKVFARLYVAAQTFHTVFECDVTDEIDLEQLERGLLRMNVELSRPQLLELMHTVAVHAASDQRVKLCDFANRFKVTCNVESDEMCALEDVGKQLLLASDGDISSILGDATLTREEFKNTLTGKGVNLTEQQLAVIFRAFDRTDAGCINAKELCSAFTVVDTANVADYSRAYDARFTWQHRTIERMLCAIHEYRSELFIAFRQLDIDNDGIVSRHEFLLGLQALTSIHGAVLTKLQCEELANTQSQIAYAKFLGSFVIEDNAKAAP